MQTFFVKPNPYRVAEHIYCNVIFVCETGGRSYKYKFPDGLSISFMNEVIDKLSEYLLDVDIIELNNGYVLIDWS